MAVLPIRPLLMRVCLILGISFLSSLVAAQDASISAENGVPGYLTANAMFIMLDASPIGTEYAVAPLTLESGLNQTSSKTEELDGDIHVFDQTNFTQSTFNDDIVYLSCDQNSNVSMITPSYILNSISTSSSPPSAILLYSTVNDYCFLTGSQLAFNLIWTTTSASDAQQIHSTITGTEYTIAASIQSNNTDNSQSNGNIGGTSVVAMSILYSITGLITILFLIIIATGAIRAHRHPERYGPRPSANGRPRQSRAKGIARAMLETLPIVKFGESNDPKPDEELGTESGVRSQELQDIPAVVASDESAGQAEPRNSTEATNDVTPEQGSQAAKDNVIASAAAKKETGAEESNDLGCSICTEDFTKGEDVRVLPCNHKFHPACVDPWLVNVSGTCPLCRLDLRPPEVIAAEAEAEAARTANTTNNEVVTPEAGENTNANTHLAPPPAEGEAEGEADAIHRRRRSRLLDWNRLRHASVDERIQALRAYRQSQQGSSSGGENADDERRHSRLGRLRERFHIRSTSQNTTQSAETTSPPVPSYGIGGISRT
ncbi:hypothetical protein F5Y16DRAFT_106615 [Xylariaceae sp. FL0255]|nr:hypothetical protein F5Y16DRAFT_106615 [Xylariaceae sp. FL0255]